MAKFTSGADLVSSRGLGPSGRPPPATVAAAAKGEKYVYEPLEFVVEGPDPPTESQVARKKYGAHIRAAEPREKAAGYTEDVAALRAIQEAMCGLYFSAAALPAADL